MKPAIAVIIPTLDEAVNLTGTLQALAPNEAAPEVLVIDAGSRDDTRALAESHGARVITAPRPSRAAQMNLGAREAEAPLLLFLHADTRLAPGALDRLVAVLQVAPAVAGGGFARRFDSNSILLHLTTRLADLRARHFGLFLGDQGIFARREHFETLGGFDESLELCEDLDFSRRLRALGATVALRPPVLTSARRFEARGPLRQTLSDLNHARRYFLR